MFIFTAASEYQKSNFFKNTFQHNLENDRYVYVTGYLIYLKHI